MARTSLRSEIAALRHTNPEPAVQKILRRGAQALPAVIAALDHPDLREGARRVVARTPDYGRAYFIKGLRHPNSYVREILFNTLHSRLPLRRTEIGSLIKLLNQPQARTALAACQLLAANAAPGRSAYVALQRLQARPEIYLQHCAWQAMLQLDPSRARRDLQRHMHDPSYEIRSQVFLAIWSRFKPADAELAAMLRRPNPAALIKLHHSIWRLSPAQIDRLAQARIPAGPVPLRQVHRLELAILLDAYQPRQNRALRIWLKQGRGLADLRLLDRRFWKRLQDNPEASCEALAAWRAHPRPGPAKPTSKASEGYALVQLQDYCSRIQKPKEMQAQARWPVPGL